MFCLSRPSSQQPSLVKPTSQREDRAQQKGSPLHRPALSQDVKRPFETFFKNTRRAALLFSLASALFLAAPQTALFAAADQTAKAAPAKSEPPEATKSLPEQSAKPSSDKKPLPPLADNLNGPDNPGHFAEDNFLQHFDLLISAQERRSPKNTSQGSELRLRLGNNNLPSISQDSFRAIPSKTNDIDKLNNNANAGASGNYLYLRDQAPANSHSDPTNRPDFSSLLAPNGDLRSLLTDVVGAAGARAGLSFGGGFDAKGHYNPGFEIALESAYQLLSDNFDATAAAALKDQLAGHEYNLGLNIGYSGFNLDASLVRDWAALGNEGRGYALGFSYQAPSWSARLAWNAYRSGSDLLGLENEARDYISVEIGANLHLSERIGLLGGIRYYDYGDRHIFKAEQGEKSQMIFIGGRLKF